MVYYDISYYIVVFIVCQSCGPVQLPYGKHIHGLGARAETVNLFCDSCAKADRVVISNGDVPVFFYCTPMSRARMRRSRDTILCTALFVETFLRSPHLR